MSKIKVHGRIELVDILLDDGWELIAQSAHHTPVQSHSAGSSSARNVSTVVETWVKKR
jgi:hypothetical protein